mmetsp:Transcript_50066/g.128875  ORF Transcript_50066/g.128875 Transcript_50066/m.128875 type:complete len:216 (+) Transcript_50066:182-829(+)
MPATPSNKSNEATAARQKVKQKLLVFRHRVYAAVLLLRFSLHTSVPLCYELACRRARSLVHFSSVSITLNGGPAMHSCFDVVLLLHRWEIVVNYILIYLHICRYWRRSSCHFVIILLYFEVGKIGLQCLHADVKTKVIAKYDRCPPSASENNLSAKICPAVVTCHSHHLSHSISFLHFHFFHFALLHYCRAMPHTTLGEGSDSCGSMRDLCGRVV